MQSESLATGIPCPVSSFLRETVRYNGHYVSRYAAMTFEKSLNNDPEAVLEVGCYEPEDMTGCPVDALDDSTAHQVLTDEFHNQHPLDYVRF